MDTSLLMLIISAIYVPILFTIYFIQLILIIANKRKPQFRSSYFSLFIVEACVSLSTTVTNTVVNRLVLFPQINSFYAHFPENWIATGLYFSVSYGEACLEYVNISVAFNRLTALAMYDRYERIWSYFFWVALSVILSFPFISYYHLVDVAVRFYPQLNGTIYSNDYDHSVRPWRSNRVQSVRLCLGCSTTTAVLNLLVIAVLRWRWASKKVSTIEVRLFLLGLSTFACGLPMTITQFKYTSIGGVMKIEYFLWDQAWLMDLKTLSPGVLSLIFSSAIREEFLKFLRLQKIIRDVTVQALQICSRIHGFCEYRHRKFPKKNSKQPIMDTSLIVLIIYAIYVPILFTMYFIQLILIIVNKRKAQFRSSYFSLFIVEAVVCLISTITNTVMNRLVLFPQINSFYANFPQNWLASALFFSVPYGDACLEYVNIFVACNRLTALALHDQYERLWSYFFWVALSVILSFPFISFYHLLDVAVWFDPYLNGTVYALDYDHSVRPWRSTRVQSVYLYLGCSSTTISLNLLAIAVLRLKWTSKRVSSIEVRLFLLGLTTFACGLPTTLNQFKYTFLSDDLDIDDFLWDQPWLMDLKTLSPGVLSLIFSSAIRDEFFKFMHIPKLRQDQNTVVRVSGY